MSEIKVLSFNVMFNDVFLMERHLSMIKYLLETDADVICLQEVLNEAHSFFVNGLCKKYRPIFNTIQPEYYSYGVAIFIKRDFSIKDRGSIVLPSKFGRVIAHTSIERCGIEYNIATSHLESMNYPGQRKIQLKMLFDAFGAKNNFIFCADTNIKNTEDIEMPGNFEDAAIVSNDLSDTYFGDRFWDSKSKQRYDKIFYCKDLSLQKYEVIFKEKDDEIKTFLSDHLAVCATLRIEDF